MQMPSTALTIFLVNQISGHGHLDLYARLYSACLLDLGYRVVLIAQQEFGVREWISKNRRERRDDFIFFSRGELKAACAADVPESLSSRMQIIWQEEGMRGLILRIVRRGLYQALRPIEIAASAVGFRSSCASRWVTWSLVHSSGVSLKPLVDEVNTAEARLGIHPDLVFFLYLDMIKDDPKGCRYLAEHLVAPWAGIKFDPRCSDDKGRTRPERFFGCSNARGAAFLNPGCVRTYEQLFPESWFGDLPDVTDASLPPRDSAFVTRLRLAARGRTVVLQLGALTPHKGIMHLLDVIRRADPNRFFFAFVGEPAWKLFGNDESELHRFVDHPPDNCLVQLGYLKDERELNSVIAVADILYAVYRDFRPSSNTLTKAAVFKKPVVVSDQYLMGERVRRYNIGVAVRSGDIDEILAAFEMLRLRKPNEFGFEVLLS